MLDFHLRDEWYQGAVAYLAYTENGRESAGSVFSPDALVGLHLTLPRGLGVCAARACLTADGGGEHVSLPLCLRSSEGGVDTYAALLVGGQFSATPLWFARLSVDSIFGRLTCVPAGGGRLRLSQEAGEGADLPLLFLSPATGRAGGALYQLPVTCLGGMRPDAYPGFFSNLASLGVSGLYLCPPAGEGACGKGQDPSACLPPAFIEAAKKQGIPLLGDLLLLAATQGDNDALLGADCPSVEEARPALWNIPFTLADGDNPTDLAGLAAEGGLVERAMRAGLGGLVIRAADCFGDAFLSAVRARMHAASEKEPLLLGGTAAPPVALAFGTRRRFFFGGELDAPLSYALRDALLAYLLLRDTAPLAAYLGDILPSMPPATLAVYPQLLSTYETGSFYAALSAETDSGRADALNTLAFLIAATLPGTPMYLAGEECSKDLDGQPECDSEMGEARRALCLRLAALRRKEGVYAGGACRLLHLSPDLLVFSREREGEALLTVVNPSDKTLTVTSPDGFSVVLGGRGRKTTFPLRPLGGIVVKIPRWEGEPCRLRFTHAAQ